jgi:hypothetical protein
MEIKETKFFAGQKVEVKMMENTDWQSGKFIGLSGNYFVAEVRHGIGYYHYCREIEAIPEMKKCYITGPITGTEDYEERFAAAEKEVRALGMEPVNPVTLAHDHDKKWSSYMRVALKGMLQCECIYVLRGWLNSEGANIEFNLAQQLEYERYYQPSTPNLQP